MSRRLGRVLAVAPLALCSAVIVWASSRPANPDRRGLFPHSDKLLHFGAFGLWATCLALALVAWGWPRTRTRRHLLVILGTLLWGITDELHQSFVPTRQPDLWDVVADTAGAVGCVVGLRVLGARRDRPPE